MSTEIMNNIASATKVVEWDMGHRVPNHKSKCKNPHGHRYRLEVTVAGPICQAEGTSDEGMVIDFSDIKNIMTEHIHDVLDHGFMYATTDGVMNRFFRNLGATFQHIQVGFIPTAENLAMWCYQVMDKHLKEPMYVEQVKLFETPNSWAIYKRNPFIHVGLKSGIIHE